MRSLFIQARGALKKQVTEHRLDRQAKTTGHRLQEQEAEVVIECRRDGVTHKSNRTNAGIQIELLFDGIQTAEGEMFLSIEELEQLAELRSRERASLTVHREAAKADVAERFEAQTGNSYENFETKPGCAKRGNAASREESRQITPLLRAQGGKP
ncbi:MAG: hypothetical protein O9341_00225 [Paucibacter sp.]|nr:hypothetical protein [Roseateles sp.]